MCCAHPTPCFAHSWQPPSPLILLPPTPHTLPHPALALCSSLRYGELALVTAPIYFNYGDILLYAAQESSDALGGPAEEPKAEGGEEDDDDDEEEEEAGGAGGGAGAAAGAASGAGAASAASAASASSAAAAAAAAAEEDLTAEDGKEEDISDLQIAFESLDVARVIYEREAKLGKPVEVDLARVFLRLGDYFSEVDNFGDAKTEYLNCLSNYGKKLVKFDKCVGCCPPPLPSSCTTCLTALSFSHPPRLPPPPHSPRARAGALWLCSLSW